MALTAQNIQSLETEQAYRRQQLHLAQADLQIEYGKTVEFEYGGAAAFSAGLDSLQSVVDKATARLAQLDQKIRACEPGKRRGSISSVSSGF